MTKNKTLHIKISQSEKEILEEVCKKKRLILSAWVRKVLLDYAENYLKNINRGEPSVKTTTERV